MPVLDGIEATKTIRNRIQSQAYSDVKVILTSSGIENDDYIQQTTK